MAENASAGRRRSREPGCKCVLRFACHARITGVTTIILPKDNEKDLADIPKAVLDVLELHLVESMDEVLQIAMAEPLAGLLPIETKPTPAATDDTVTH